MDLDEDLEKYLISCGLDPSLIIRKTNLIQRKNKILKIKLNLCHEVIDDLNIKN